MNDKTTTQPLGRRARPAPPGGSVGESSSVDPGTLMPSLNSMFFRAIHAGDAAALKELLELGVDARSARSKKGASPVPLACRAGSLECLKLLIDAKADVDGKCSGGWTGALWAAAMGELEMLEALIKGGADLTLGDRGGRTPLAGAICQGEPRTARHLILHGAALNQVDQFGRSPAMHACVRRDAKSLALLIEAGADLNLKDGAGKSALCVALELGDAQTCALIRSRLDQRALDEGLPIAAPEHASRRL